jgi:proteasome lid subunit RPN8/RPN11
VVEREARLVLRPEHIDDVVRHAREGAPDEVCGILPGRDGIVTRVIRGKNVASNPRLRYELDPNQQYAAFREMEAEGESMLGIYHSHPFSPAFPSNVDLEMAFYPGSIYVIVSLADPSKPQVRAFRLGGRGTIAEAALVIDSEDRTRLL